DRTVLPEADTTLHQAIQALHTPLLHVKAADNFTDYFMPPAFSPTGNLIVYPLQILDRISDNELTAVADISSGQVLYTLKGEPAGADRLFNNRVATLGGAGGEIVDLHVWDIGSPDHAQLLQNIPFAFEDKQDTALDANPNYFATWSPSRGTQ